MYTNPFVAQLLAEERMRDAIRRNEQARLIQTAKGSRQTRQRRLSTIFARKNSLPINRPQRKRLSAHTPNL
jgi:hypothetical protein